MTAKKTNAFEVMKTRNLEDVFHEILEKRAVSRVEIAAATGLTKMTVSNCVKYLISKGMIHEVETEKQPVGRPPIKLELDPAIGLFLGIEVNILSCKAVITDVSGHMMEQKVITDMAQSPEVFLRHVHALIADFEKNHETDRRKIVGIGVALPGIYNGEKDSVEYISTMRNWNGYALQAALRSEFPGTVICIQNAARAGAKGEIFFGNSEQNREMAYILGAMGLALSLYTNDGIHVGERGFMSRFGHMIVKEGGRPCRCGNKGCLEMYASVGALGRRLYPDRDVDDAVVRQLLERSRKPDAEFRKAMKEVIRYFAVGVSNIINCFDPKVVCVGGYFGMLLEPFSDEVNEAVNALLLGYFQSPHKVICSSLGEWGAAIGCLPSLRESLFREMYLEDGNVE